MKTRLLVYSAGVLALALVALVLVAPALIDTPAVRAEIQRRLSATLQGQVSWQSLEIELLPVPRGELHGLRVEIPGKLGAEAEELRAYLRFWPLLHGQAEIAEISVRRPRLRLLAVGGEKAPATDAVVAYRSAVEPVARALQGLAPDTTVGITGAQLDLEALPLQLRNVNVYARTGAKGLEFELAAGSALWKRLALTGRVEYAALAAQAQVELDDFAPDRELPALTLRAELRTDGRSAVDGTFDARVRGLAAAKGEFALPAGKPPELSAQVENADVAQAIALVRRKLHPVPQVESAEGRLSAKVNAHLGADWSVQLDLVKSDATVKLTALPAPLAVSGGAIRADRERIRLDKVAVALLDARTLASGQFIVKDQAVELSITEGTAGERLVRWAMERGAVPPRFEPRLPVRFSAQRVAWAPQKPLEAEARLRLDGGAEVALALSWQPGRLELRRAALKDAHSDAVFGATLGPDLIRARFAGTFQGRSLDGLLRQPPAATGSAQGELQVTIDRARPGRTAAEGRLRVEALDLSWLAGRKALIERAELASRDGGLRVSGARFSVEDQPFELSGEGRRTPQGPVVEARLESPGFELNRLLPPGAERGGAEEEESRLWPLPVRGRVEVKSGFVQFEAHRIEPLAGTVTLEPRRARLEIQAARACGVSFPAELEATPEDLSATARLSVQDAPLEETLRCLTGGTMELSGKADLTAELTTRGRRPHLVRNLTGTAQATLREGRVKRFALLGNVLSFRDIASIQHMREEGFPYRSMTARGRFAGGEFRVEEAFFDSDAVRLAAHGHVDLLGAGTQLTVLVGLLARVDRIAEAVPIVGDIFGGSMTALPVRVHGDIRDPAVVPLGPRAVSDQLLGIFERTLKLPGKLFVRPGAKPEDKN